MMSSSEFGFRTISWSIRTEGLFDPSPGLGDPVGGVGSFLGVAETVKPQQDILQFVVRVSDSGGVITNELSISDACSSDMTQWNYVMDCVTWFMVKVELIFRNHACGEQV
jgi:hypothetical protein